MPGYKLLVIESIQQTLEQNTSLSWRISHYDMPNLDHFSVDGSVLQGQITKIPLSCELGTIICLTPEMLSFNFVYNT